MGSLECLLCRCQMPAHCTGSLTSHLQSEHRILFHHSLLCKLSLLNKDGIIRVKAFISEILAGTEDEGIFDRDNGEPFLDPNELVKIEQDQDEEIETKSIKYEPWFKEEDNKDYFQQFGEASDDGVKQSMVHYTLEQRQFCVDFYTNVACGGDTQNKADKGWHEHFTCKFYQRFPECKNVPPRGGVLRILSKFKQYGSVESRWKGNSGKKKDAPAPSIICDLCGYVGNTVRAVYKHKQRLHSEKIECPDCGKLVVKVEMKQHRLKHLPESERKWKCAHCGKGFTQKQKLQEHELIHTDERPFSCKYVCGYCCKSQSNLGKHEQICTNKSFSRKNFESTSCQQKTVAVNLIPSHPTQFFLPENREASQSPKML